MYKVYWCHYMGFNVHEEGPFETLEEAQKVKEANEDSLFDAWIVEVK